MGEKPYRVHVVVDPAYGERLRNLPVREPIWVVSSPENQPVIQSLWNEHKSASHPDGITSFVFDPDAASEDWLIAEISVIDLHHGEFSHSPAYSILNVIGVRWSDRIQEVLARFGFDYHEPTTEGFVAKRKTGHEQR